VVRAAVSDPPSAETVLLLLDAAHRGLACAIVSGAATGAHLRGIGDVVVSLAADSEGRLAAVVLATVRPDAPGPSRADEEFFVALRQRLGDHGVDLLDWFLLGGSYALSVAEITGACWRWLGAEPP
jgi:DNA repair protein RadC